jgi:hypothetical protein
VQYQAPFVQIKGSWLILLAGFSILVKLPNTAHLKGRGSNFRMGKKRCRWKCSDYIELLLLCSFRPKAFWICQQLLRSYNDCTIFYPFFRLVEFSPWCALFSFRKQQVTCLQVFKKMCQSRK